MVATLRGRGRPRPGTAVDARRSTNQCPVLLAPVFAKAAQAGGCDGRSPLRTQCSAKKGSCSSVLVSTLSASCGAAVVRNSCGAPRLGIERQSSGHLLYESGSPSGEGFRGLHTFRLRHAASYSPSGGEHHQRQSTKAKKDVPCRRRPQRKGLSRSGIPLCHPRNAPLLFEPHSVLGRSQRLSRRPNQDGPRSR